MSETRLDNDAGEVARNVRIRQLRLLFEQGGITLVGVVINALFLVFLFRDLVPPTLLGVWLGLALITYGLRFRLSRAYRHLSDEQLEAERLLGYFTLGTMSSGLLWGVFGAMLLDYASPMHLGLLVIILGGMSAATIATYAVIRGLSAAFILPAMLPLALRLLSEGGELYLVMGILLLVFTVVLLSSAERSYQASIVGMRLAEEQGRLAVASEEARERSEELVSRLEREIEERSAVEHDLRQSQSRFEHAQRITGFGHWEWDLKSGEIWWSDNMYRISGRMREDFSPTAEAFAALIHPDDLEPMQEAMGRVMAGHNQPINYRLCRPDGEWRHIHTEGELIVDGSGEPLYMSGIAHDVTAQVRAEEELRRSERELNNILTNLQDTFYRTNLQGEVIYMTPQIERAMGYTPEELLGRKLSELYVDPGMRDKFIAELQANGEVRNWIAPLRHKDGSVVWGSANAHFYRDDAGNILGVEGITRDITKLKQAEAALQREQQRALVTLESIGDGVITTDVEGRIEYLNPVAEQLVGEARTAIGCHYSEALPLVEEDNGEPLDDLVELTLRHEGGLVNASNGLLHRDDGGDFVLKVSAAAMRADDGSVIGAVLVLHDITETMAMTRQLNYQASHDTLTGLVNRREFQSRLEKAIANARESGCEHTLLFMDLDQFKVVNDTCGHRAGDELLKQLAVQLDEATRDSDTVARLGGDEFAVLLVRCPMERAREIADDLRQRVKEFRFVWEDKSFEIGVSIGAVAVNRDSGGIERLLSAADAACYFAKEQGRNRVFVYNVEDGVSIQRHGEMSWVHRISEAFENDRFCLDAQLIAPLDEGSEEAPHYEVLVRMRSEEGTLVPPMAFIPAAERYNLMPTIDRWVVRTTFGMLREAQASAERPPIACSINLSGQTLTDDHFMEFVITQLEESGLPPDSICFEVTETAAITNLTRAMKLIGELKHRGCRFSLDDFGSGLSSFGYLKNLPVDFLKIDGAFVKDILSDEIDLAMVEAIHRVGAVMQLQTIAEFVENDEIADKLREIGVNYVQGYGVARPEPLDSILERHS